MIDSNRKRRCVNAVKDAEKSVCRVVNEQRDARTAVKA